MVGRSPLSSRPTGGILIALALGACGPSLAPAFADGDTKIATPIGTVEHRGPWVPNPAPTTINVYGCDELRALVGDAGRE